MRGMGEVYGFLGREKCFCALRNDALRVAYWIKTWNTAAEPTAFSCFRLSGDVGPSWLLARVLWMDETCTALFEMRRVWESFRGKTLNSEEQAFVRELENALRGMVRRLEDAAVSTFGETIAYVFLRNARSALEGLDDNVALIYGE